MRRDLAALGLDRQPALDPGDEAADEVVGRAAAGAEGLGGDARPRPGSAIEDDRPLGIQRIGLGSEPVHDDVMVAGYAASLVLVILTHVDELDLAVTEQLGNPIRLELLLLLGERTHGREATARPPGRENR